MVKKIKETLIAVWLADISLLSAHSYAASERPFNITKNSGDMINVTPESFDAAVSLTWMISGLSIVTTTTLLIMSAKKLHREDYYGAMLTFIGALISGSGPYLSSVLFLG